MFMLPLFALSQEIAEPTAFLSPCFHFQKSLQFGRLQFPSRPLGLKWYFRPRGENVFNWIISYDLLNDFDISIFLKSSSGNRSSPDIFFTLSSLASDRCFRTWVLITYQFYKPFLFLLSFASTKVPLPSIFGKLAGTTLFFTLTLTVLLRRNTRLFIFRLLLLSLVL